MLFHRFHGGLDAAAGLLELFLRGGVGEADAVVIAEGAALHGGDVGVQQDVEGEVLGVLDDGFAVLFGELGVGGHIFAVKGFHLREEVEGTLRQAHFEAGNLLEQVIDEVAALLEGGAHLEDVLGSGGIHLHCA